MLAAFRAWYRCVSRPGLTPIDRMIDEATGRQRAFVDQYITWFNQNIGEKFNTLHKGRVWTPNWICPSPL